MRRTIGAIIGVVALASQAVQAHHGYAGFFMDRTVTVEGDIEELRYANPHVVMKIRTADSTLYTVTWQAATWVAKQAAVTSSTFKAGDHLIVAAAPARDPASHELASVRVVRRPSDGWAWTRQTPFPPSSNYAGFVRNGSD